MAKKLTDLAATTADRVIADIFDVLSTVGASPHIGPRRRDVTLSPLRFNLIREYLIAYAPDESPLWVVAVLHGPQSSRHGGDSPRPRGTDALTTGRDVRVMATIARTVRLYNMCRVAGGREPFGRIRGSQPPAGRYSGRSSRIGSAGAAQCGNGSRCVVRGRARRSLSGNKATVAPLIRTKPTKRRNS
jgi:plasmid stabilization system protein ParE